jgi:CheY-like chemotaxis protein
MAKTVLLADDSVTIQKVVGISFAGEDLNLVTVDNGDAALAKAREIRPDAILADVVMPGRNGYEVCEALKADPALAHIPVLLLTGTFEAFDEARAKRCGAAGHIAKPFESQLLVERVRQLLARPAPPAPAPAPPAPAAAASGAPAASGESFDFFDDDLGDLAGPGAGESASDLALEGSGPAFAFGDDDLGGASTGGRVVSAAAPESRAQAMAERTIAMEPPERRRREQSAPPTRLDPSLGLESDGDDDLLAGEFDAPSQTPGAADEGFDFEFAASGRRGAAAGPVSADDLAAATVLDPKGASGFDVSFSDLGDPQAREAWQPAGKRAQAVTPPLAKTPVPPPATPPAAVADDPWAELDAAAPAPPARKPRPQAPVPPPPRSVPLPRPMSAAAQPPAAPPARPAPAAAPPKPVPPPAPPRAAKPARPAALEEPAWEPAVAATSLDDSFSELPAAEPAEGRDRRAHGTHDPAALAGMALADITPRLRQELHDTLEKIAWESFGPLAEQLVRQMVERMERIAWEVIPQLAETLIREEIRRMKGEE